MDDRPMILGIDIGGTKVALGKVGEDGALLAQTRFPFPVGSPERLVPLLLDHAERFLQGERPRGIGVGLKGMVAADGRTVLHSSLLEKAPPVDLGGVLGERLGAPCVLDNDVHAATLAEIRLGAGRGERNFVFLNLGTGLAAGIVCEGKLLRGAQNAAGELGATLALRPEGGEAYPLEALVSGSGLALEARRLTREDTGGALAQRIRQGETLTGRAVLEARRAGDPLAVRAVAHLVEALCRVLYNLTLFLDPALFVFAGGVLGDGALLTLLGEAVETRFRALAPGRKVPDLRLSTLGADEAGVLGAACVYLAWRDAP